MNRKDIKDIIINELIDLKLPLNHIGFEYYTELLLAEYRNEFKTPNMMKRYEYLAKKYNSSIAAVERVLRRGKDSMEKQIKRKYKIKTKITAETILILFRLKVF